MMREREVANEVPAYYQEVQLMRKLGYRFNGVEENGHLSFIRQTREGRFFPRFRFDISKRIGQGMSVKVFYENSYRKSLGSRSMVFDELERLDSSLEEVAMDSYDTLEWIRKAVKNELLFGFKAKHSPRRAGRSNKTRQTLSGGKRKWRRPKVYRRGDWNSRDPF